MTLLKNYIDGQFVDGERRYDNISPVNGERICEVAEADETMVDQAVTAARRALRGEWGQLDTRDRCELLLSVAKGIEERFDDFVEAEIADTGKPLLQTRTLDIPRVADNFKFFAGYWFRWMNGIS